MANRELPYLEIDGAPPSAAQLAAKALVHYGHFTAMQVRGAAVRGLDLHLTRLSAANKEMFGTDLDGDQVRGYIRRALTAAGVSDASVRVLVYPQERGQRGPVARTPHRTAATRAPQREAGAPDTAPDGPADDCRVLVVVRPLAPMPTGPCTLRSVPYQRAVPHLKHLGDFGQMYYGLSAQRDGFDDALLTGADGVISEGRTTNIGFFDGDTVTWPDAPALAGTTMRLLQPRLAGAGLPSRRGTVRLADLPSYTGVFVTSSRGIAPVGRIDDTSIPVDARLMRTLDAIYEALPLKPV